MAEPALDFLRQDALAKRVKGAAGGNRILWSARDIGIIRERIWASPEKTLREAPAIRKFVAPDPAALRAKLLADAGLTVRGDMQPSDLKFVFRISSEDVDLANDVVKIGAWQNLDQFAKNPPVLFAHNSAALPIAISTKPWISGATLLAIAKFPQPGVSAESDQVATAIRASLVRGASVGFIPLKWSFTKDPSRPFGVDFEIVQLLEWSVCSLPCNPSCLVIGAASEKSRRPFTGRYRDVSDPGDENDWRCCGSDILPIDSSDDPFDAKAAQTALLAKFSSSGTILPEEAAKCFMAYDAEAPLDPASYRFPFAKLVDNVAVAAKVGWREAIAALEKSGLPGLPVSDARSLVDRLERRLESAEMKRRRAEALGIAETTRRLLASPRPAPLSRSERVAQAARIRRSAYEILDRD